MTTDSHLAARAVAALGEPPPAPAHGLRSGDLSAGELLALQHAGLEAVAVVSGTSVTQVMTNSFMAGRVADVTALGAAMTLARRSAIARLVSSATDHAATGVVGVRVQLHWEGGGTVHEVRVTSTGTAVVGAGRGTPVRATTEGDGARPFLATLDGVGVSRLAWSGWAPLGLAFGVSVQSLPRRSGSRRGGEAGGLTASLYAARENAMAQLDADARRSGADGVIGIELTQDRYVWGRRVMEFAAIGTAIGRTARSEELRDPEFAISLRGSSVSSFAP